MTEPDFLHRTRASYDTLAADYTEWIRDELAARPLDRALLAAFAELTRNSGPVADIGCGPGRITAHLNTLGVPAFGIDLSPAMIAIARQTHPGLRFEVGTMTALDLPDNTLAGIVAWYSLIHIPLDHQPAVLAEFHRALAPGAHLLLAFQLGDDISHRTEAGGHAISLDFHRLNPDHLTTLLTQAGLAVHAQLRREPEDRPRFPRNHSAGLSPGPETLLVLLSADYLD